MDSWFFLVPTSDFFGANLSQIYFGSSSKTHLSKFFIWSIRLVIEEGDSASLINSFKIFHQHHDNTKVYDFAKLHGKDVLGLEELNTLYLYKLG